MAKRSVIDEFRGKYFFLSNFYEQTLVYQNVMYPTAEHAFQASKTLNERQRHRISKLASPGTAKRTGRAIALRSDWEEVKVQIMEEIIELKFGKSILKKRLLATDNALLIEGNNWGDAFWGATLEERSGKHIKIWDGRNHLWYGRNELGRILMDFREKLRT